eukprot:SAG31_NODE_7572_length_1651_cov_0.978737_5_plen_86_part_01
MSLTHVSVARSWGAAELYRITQKCIYKEYALKHSMALVNRQEDEGWYHYTEFSESVPQLFFLPTSNSRSICCAAVGDGPMSGGAKL